MTRKHPHDNLRWQRIAPGKYGATDATGTRWLCVQWTSQRWAVLRDGHVETEQCFALWDAKWWVADEVHIEANPHLVAMRAAASARRRALREARAS